MKKYILITFIIIFATVNIVFAGGTQQTSGVTLNALLTNVRYYLNEPTASFWDDAELLTYLKNGIADVVARTGCIEYSGITGIDSGVTRLDYRNVDHYGIKSIILVGEKTKGLFRGNLQEIGHVTDTGEPNFWVEKAGYLYFYPVPSSAVSIEITGVSNPQAFHYDGDEEIPTPAYFDHLLIYYVVGQAYYQDRKFNEANVYMMQYYDGLNQFRRDYVESRQETIPSQTGQ